MSAFLYICGFFLRRSFDAMFFGDLCAFDATVNTVIWIGIFWSILFEIHFLHSWVAVKFAK